MGVLAGKPRRNDNESDGEQQKRTFRSSTALERDGQNKVSSSTTLYNLPLEMLDIILKKTYLHWILNSSARQRDEEVIRSLTSVDVCFNRRITRQRFKKAIRRYLKDFYEKNMRNTAISRNNKDYFLKNIQPNDEFIDSLFHHNCITEEQRHFIQSQRSKRDKNAELLHILRSFDNKKLSNTANCFRQTNQTEVARLVENGGVAIKTKVKNCGTTRTQSMDSKLLHQNIEDLRKRTKLISHETESLISRLKDEGIEILNSQLDRQTVVVWIWCRSQAALECIQKLYESNQLRDVFFENIQPSTSKLINIDMNQFKKTVVVCSISFNFTHRIIAGGMESMSGVTKLRNEIYVLVVSYSNDTRVIRVFEDRSPFPLQKEMKIKKIINPRNILSSEMENCLYVSDRRCIWKIVRQTRYEHEIIRWLNPGFLFEDHWSVSTDGHLLIADYMSSILTIYGSDAKLFRSIQLPRDIEKPRHAVETSIGNFIILHKLTEKEDVGENGSDGRQKVMKWGISELTRNGQMVIRRFIPSNETQLFLSLTENYTNYEYFLLDSDDRVFITDRGNNRIILLDSNLKWNRILCTIEKVEDPKFEFNWNLCYDEEKKQLIVGQYNGVNIYT